MNEQETREAYAEMELIGREILTGWRQRGQVNYGDAFVELGTRGQFSDIWRKIKKLKRAVWEGVELQGEQPEQIAAEIIPHCLMMIYLLTHETPHSTVFVGARQVAPDVEPPEVKYRSDGESTFKIDPNTDAYLTFEPDCPDGTRMAIEQAWNRGQIKFRMAS